MKTKFEGGEGSVMDQKKDLKGALQGLQLQAQGFLEGRVRRVLITNTYDSFNATETTYSLIIEPQYLTYIEKDLYQTSTLRMHLSSCDVYENDRLMPRVFVDFFIQKVKGVFMELKAKKAQYFETEF